MLNQAYFTPQVALFEKKIGTGSMQKPTVLIAEDDVMIADCLEEILEMAGYSVCGIASTTEQAIELGRRYTPDLGVFDLRLSDGGMGTDIGPALHPRNGFGILYASGNPDSERFQNAVGEAVIGKPYTAKSIVAALGIVHERVHGLPLSTFPPGFRLLGYPAA
jgi:two-component system, response regulator PdtaR